MPGHALLGYLQVVDPALTPEAVLLLEISPGVDDKSRLAILITAAPGLKYIWERRIAKKQVCLFSMRAEIEAKISILRKTRHRETSVIMCEMLGL